MIYELEKVKLYGISWLNYSVIYLMLTILLIVLTVLWWKEITAKTCTLDEDFAALVAFMLMFLTMISIVVTMITATSDDYRYRSQTVPLSTIDNKITVQGEKVVIDELDKSYDYYEYSNDNSEFGKRKANRSNRQIFKFEYSDLYESGKLIKENGSYYNLSKEDIKYLKENGAL